MSATDTSTAANPRTEAARSQQPDGKPKPQGRGGTRPDRAAWWFLGPFVGLFVLTFAAPIVYALYQSFLTTERHGPLGLGRATTGFAGLENYTLALGEADFLEGFGRVLLFGVVQVPLMLVLATVLALLLEHVGDRWAGLLRASFFLPYGVPGVIASILWGFLYIPGVSPITDLLGRVGAAPDFLSYDTVLWSLANIVIWEFAGYNMLVIVAQLKSIPQELYEAAKIDGAGAWQTALRIKIPLIRPALVLTAVFSIIGTLQLFSEPLLLKPLTSSITTDYTPNLSAYNDAFANNNISLAAAKSVLLALVACALSFGFLGMVNRGDGPRKKETRARRRDRTKESSR